MDPYDFVRDFGKFRRLRREREKKRKMEKLKEKEKMKAAGLTVVSSDDSSTSLSDSSSATDEDSNTVLIPQKYSEEFAKEFAHLSNKEIRKIREERKRVYRSHRTHGSLMDRIFLSYELDVPETSGTSSSSSEALCDEPAELASEQPICIFRKEGCRCSVNDRD